MGFESVDEVGAAAGCGESIQEIRKEARTYTGCLQGWPVPFIKAQLRCLEHIVYSEGGSCDVVLCYHDVKALVWTLMICLMGTLLPRYRRFTVTK